MSETGQNSGQDVFLATPSSGEALPTTLRIADGKNLAQVTASEVHTDPETGKQSVRFTIEQLLGDNSLIVRKVKKQGEPTA